MFCEKVKIVIYRDQAIVIGQALLDARYLELITVQQQVFSDSYTLYKPGEVHTQFLALVLGGSVDIDLCMHI